MKEQELRIILQVPLSEVFVEMMKNEKEDELASFIKIARGSTVEYPHPYQVRNRSG